MSAVDPIELQVIVGALRAACEEMGATLVRSAHSANIKERRDASTALFDRDGEMVMQAEHIPVHLGSMPSAVRAVVGERHREGVSWVLNDPYEGGTHLPDITVVTPVFSGDSRGRAQSRAFSAHARESPRGEIHNPSTDTSMSTPGSTFADPISTPDSTFADPSTSTPTDPSMGALIGFAASRAHHADVGARVPGSMPADSRSLDEEGVVISPQPMTAEAVERIVAKMRQPQERRADLRAQLAANRVGALRLAELAGRVGVERLKAATDAVLDYAERRTRACIAGMADGVREADDVLEAIEGDIELRLKATVEGEQMVLDFTGTAGRHEGNLNCPLAVTLSACWFAVRVLTDPDIPPCSGAYRPVEVIVPEGCLLNAQPSPSPTLSGPSVNPTQPHPTPNPTSSRPSTGSDSSPPLKAAAGGAPAVAAGNVETSSRVADLVLGAFGRALGQGTMNNLTLGNDDFTYYETLGGGQGACEDGDGPSGVHVAMSNTLNTPVEALERELPVRVSEYALRRESGGAGEHRGGEGVVRELEALEEMTFSLIGERRRHAPPGAGGGEAGKPGQDWLIGVDGERQPLPAKTTGRLRKGERLRIETPGGGGCGSPADDNGPSSPPSKQPPPS